VSPKDKDEQEKTLDAEGADEPAENDQSSAESKSEPTPIPTESKSSVSAKYRSEIRIAVISALAAVLVGAIFTPARDWTGGAVDSVHDFFRGYDGKRLDDMKETIEDRPFWQDDPSFKDSAFEYVDETDIGEPVYTTLSFDSTRPRVIGVDDLVNDAPNADPDPVILLGRVFDESSVKARGSHPYIYDEQILTGRERYLYVGTDEPSYTWEGIAGYIGVLIATGRALDEDEPAGVETAYFVGVQGIEVNPSDPILQPELERLAPGKFK